MLVLVTRPERQATRLNDKLRQQGWQPVSLPVIDIQPLIMPKVLDDLIRQRWHWLIFISANAVECALNLAGGDLQCFGTVRVAAIGKSTRAALNQAGICVDLTPSERFDSEALLALTEMQAVQGLSILIIRGQEGRETLAETLTERGADVFYWEVYRRVRPAIVNPEVLAQIEHNDIDVLTVTSVESLENLLAMMPPVLRSNLYRLPLVVFSERIRQFAEQAGFARIEVTDEASDDGMVAGIARVLAGALHQRGI